MASEKAVARRVVRFLKADGWEVYQEVLCPNRRFVVDIYAVKGNTTWAIEVKTKFGLAVMEQATTWKKYAHRSSIAVPRPKSRRARTFGYKVCGLLGIGVIEIGPRSVSEKITSPRTPRPRQPELVEEQKLGEAGNAEGKYWTPFKDTVRKLEDVVRQEPGISLEEAVGKIDHHYKNTRSAVSSLVKHIKRGTISTLHIRYRKGEPLLYTR